MPTQPEYRFHPFELDVARSELRRNAQNIHLQPKAFEVLTYLVEHRDRPVPARELIANVWKAQVKSDSTVPTSIAAIRKALGDDAAQPHLIATVRGRGYRFIAELDRPEMPLPMAARVTPFVGREEELLALGAAWQSAQQCMPGLVLVSGDAGIGKTRLLEEFVGRLDHDAIAIAARCREEPGAPALWPWIQIVRSCLARYGEKQFLDSLPRIEPLLLSTQVSVPRREVPYEAEPRGEPARFRLFDGVASFLRTAATREPLLLVFDDLHRADAASIRLLAFVAHEFAHSPTLILAAARGTIDRPSSLSPLADVPSITHIPLKGLPRSNAAQLAALLSNSPPPNEALIEEIYESSSGNPFYLNQLLRFRSLSNPSTDGRFLGQRDNILQQLSGLPEGTRELLSLAAIIGREFPVPLMAAVAEQPALEVLNLLRPAASAGIIGPAAGREGHLRFTHILLRDALYDSLRSADLSHLHRRVADQLARLHGQAPGEQVAQLSHHYVQGVATGCANEALLYTSLAADAASDRLAFEEAVELYRTALQVAELIETPSSSECHLLLALGQVELRAELRQQGRETLQRAATLARKLRQPALLAHAALSLAPGPFAIEVGVYDPLLVSLLEEALEVLPDAEVELRSRVLARLSIALVWANQESRRKELSVEALEQARRTEDPEAIALALTARHGVLGGPNNLADRIEIADEIGAIASPAQKPTLGFMHRTLRIADLLELGDIHGVDQEIQLYAREAEESRQPHFLWYASLFKAMRALMSGRYHEAKSLAERFFQMGQRVNDENSAHSFGAHQVIHLWDAGRISEAIAINEAFGERYPGVAGWRSALPILLFENGQIDQARLEFDRLANRGFHKIPRNETWGIGVTPLALACARLKDQRRAEEILDLLEPGLDYFGVLGFAVAHLGSIAPLVGILHAVLGRWKEAGEVLEYGIEQDRRIGAMQWVARNHYEAALALATSPILHLQERARKHARTALETSKAFGIPNVRKRVESMI